MEKSLTKMSKSGIELTVSEKSNKSVLRVDEHGAVHISLEKITVTECES